MRSAPINRVAPAAALAVLGAAQVLRHRSGPRAAVPVSLVATGLLLALARRAGHSWDGLGLGPAAARRGLRHGAAAAGAVAALYTAGALLPATRSLFADQRAEPDLAGLLRQALVEVPLGTVLLEETAFRAVLPALLREAHGQQAAHTVPVVLFGLWHILPSAALAEANPALAPTRATAALGSVATTAAGGAVFAALRHRTGSLLAPVLLHTAVNSLGYAAAWTVNRHRSRRRRSGPGA
jgi:membrane protease YdiL (CAAX protease family)